MPCLLVARRADRRPGDCISRLQVIQREHSKNGGDASSLQARADELSTQVELADEESLSMEQDTLMYAFMQEVCRASPEPLQSPVRASPRGRAPPEPPPEAELLQSLHPRTQVGSTSEWLLPPLLLPPPLLLLLLLPLPLLTSRI